jgi:hypothetical protein
MAGRFSRADKGVDSGIQFQGYSSCQSNAIIGDKWVISSVWHLKLPAN